MHDAQKNIYASSLRHEDVLSRRCDVLADNFNRGRNRDCSGLFSFFADEILAQYGIGL